jgi:hypothetical protein
LQHRLLIRWRDFIAALVLAGSLHFAATFLAQTSTVEGNVAGADGRLLQGAEVRFDQKAEQISPIISRTDANGHITAALPRSMYEMTLVAGGKVQASINVKATGANSRIDFDLRPSRETDHTLCLGRRRHPESSAGPLG